MNATKETLAAFILAKINNSSDWNQKFYDYKNEGFTVFIDNENINVDNLVPKDENGFFHSSVFIDYFNGILGDLIDAEFDLDFEDITLEEYNKIKKDLIASL